MSKNKCRYHCGDIEKYFGADDIIPEGFIKGGKKCKPEDIQKRLNTRKANFTGSKFKGKVCYNNGEVDKYFAKDELISEGWQKGRIKKHITNALEGHKADTKWQNSIRGTKAYNNGVSVIFLHPEDIIPEGYVQGGLSKSEEWKKHQSEINKNKFTINNGIISKYWYDENTIPEGWVKGSCKKRSDKWKEKHSKILASKDVQKKRNETCFKNNSFNTSIPETFYLEYLINKYGKDDIEQNYDKDERYPFKCDFYIKSKDLFIELNLHWTHGGKPYDEKDPECIEKLKLWEEKAKTSTFYKNAIHVWTGSDIKKQKIAKENNLNYMMYYNKKELPS